jgi:uncharacterized protein (TIGR00730 family)
MTTDDHAVPSNLAYHNERFLDSEDARPLRILAEYLEPFYRFKSEGIQDTVVFFGSARVQEAGPFGGYYAAARQLARGLTEWSQTLPGPQRFVVCSGGGGGIMEAANRGAADAGGRSIGLNIGLPQEQRPNTFITPQLSFEFHYFFMRKLWFAHLARALVAFPGGFGTLDELSEMLTLRQTGKLARPVPILLYGSSYWREILNFDALARHGMIGAEDLDLFQFADDVPAALRWLQSALPTEPEPTTPAFAKSQGSTTTVANAQPSLPENVST